ncbi:MAG: HlyC/CorC family transporter [Lachnospiraceae bacterium]|nr:HlyC/CorC family transporter [Lachnospiraceae bacterium]
MEDERRLWKNLKQIVSGESPESKEEVQEAVEHVVEECGSQGYLEENEVRMIKNVLQYSGKNARDIMTHRKDIVAVDGSETLEYALQFMLDERFTRFPVYEEDIDDIIGTIHLRDAMKYYLNKELRPVKVKELKDCLREVSFIPETKGLSRLFKQMNAEKNHLFIVLDEYGQTAGIVAMEDIIEEIVGNIFDEYDEEEMLYSQQENGTYLVKGKVALDDLEEILGIKIEDEENETLNGFLISKLERIPSEDETCEVRYNAYCFRILCVDNNMIELVEVEKIED